MTPEEAALNLQQAANPASQMTPTDALMAQLQQVQMKNLRAQQEQAATLEEQIENFSGKPKGRDFTPWAMLVDAIAPGKNLTAMAQAMKPKDPMAEKFRLEQQLQNVRSGVANTASGLLNQQRMMAKPQEAMNLEALRQQNKLEYLDKQYDLQQQLAQFKQNQKAQAAPTPQGGPDLTNLTKGQVASDKEFGKDYQKWVSGGFANVESNLAKLQRVKARLSEGDQLGSVLLPEFVRARTAPETVAVEQEIGSVVFQSLKEILGGQFTEKEGQRLVQQSYDPRLEDKDNIKKLEGAIKKLERMAQAKQKAADYFNTHGSLKGFGGTKDTTLEQFKPEGGGNKMDAEAELRKELGL